MMWPKTVRLEYMVIRERGDRRTALTRMGRGSLLERLYEERVVRREL